MKPSDRIREIWMEMKELKYLRGMIHRQRDRERLEKKFEYIEILFGHEETLSKAIIYFLDEQYETNKI